MEVTMNKELDAEGVAQPTATEELAGMISQKEVIEEHAARDSQEEVVFEGEDEDASIDWKVTIPASCQ